MRVPTKWIGVLALGMGLPGCIFFLGKWVHTLIQQGFVGRELGFGAFFVAIGGILFTMVVYAIKKGKS